MRKIFRHALTGFVVASFSQFAFAQSQSAPPTPSDSGATSQSKSSERSASDPGDYTKGGVGKQGKGKGWAKGHDR